ncbi:hypothetical protein FSP39_000078 [Pinctada imbricata]|uniref:G-protein coupled receptors family 1 profile domain-containing protein n=1 Tax=Pinctada imbricata TaxID=66713 RepID=A0AA88XTG2_PINIB|nr:hypothetical protein FSP39_000078 [Pinctada imbricata]
MSYKSYMSDINDNVEMKANASNYTEVCIQENEICDGVSHCSSGEDEENCACPDGCTRCQGSSYKCRPESLPEIPQMAKSIDISGYKMDIGILCNMTRKHLEKLDVSNTKVQNLKCLDDKYFPALQELDVSSNNITVLDKLNFPKLKTIRVDNNPIQKLYFLSSINMTIRNANIKRMEWIINENDPIAPLAFKTVINYTEPDPMGAKIECKLKAIDLSYNSMPLLDTLGHCQSLKELNLARNKITVLDFWSFNGMQSIEKVDLSYNWLESIQKSNFFGLTFLQELDLSYNRLTKLDPESFFDLSKLKILRLNNNKFQTLPWPVFSGLVALEDMYLQENKIKTLPLKIFQRTTKLLRLDLRNNNLTELVHGIFMSLGKLVYLDLRGNEIQAYEAMFSGLGVLEKLRVHSFTLCCSRPASVGINDCEAPADIFSSCTNLINLGFLSVCIWFTAIMSVFGNMMAVIYRIREGTWIKEMRDIFISSLCLSDMCMGVYLFIIAFTDVQSRGEYGYYHQQWTKSRLCDAAGVLVTASSEASTLFILAITLDRYTVFKYPFSQNVHKRSIAIASMIVIWIFAIVVAIIPFFFPDFFGGSFYTRSSVCISLPLTPTTLQYSGWEYSVGLFIVFNLFVYFIVVAGQIFIFKEIRRSGVQNDKKREREIAVAKNLSAVVISDTLCWIPVAIVGFFALNGIDVTNDVYAWIIVFVLPVNSAINPFLYTFLAMRRKRAKVGGLTIMY